MVNVENLVRFAGQERAEVYTLQCRSGGWRRHRRRQWMDCSVIHALLLAATMCDMGNSVHAADILLSKADAAITAHDIVTAKNNYDAAMNDLTATLWFPEDRSCDQPEYTLERYVTILHSLRVAVETSVMTPLNAAEHVREMRDDVFKSLPDTAADVFIRRYPELKTDERAYITAIESAAQPQKIAAHDPTGPGCQPRDIDAEVLDQAEAIFPLGARRDVSVQPVVKVNLAADGA